jgi:hypothetical protein
MQLQQVEVEEGVLVVEAMVLVIMPVELRFSEWVIMVGLAYQVVRLLLLVLVVGVVRVLQVVTDLLALEVRGVMVYLIPLQEQLFIMAEVEEAAIFGMADQMLQLKVEMVVVVLVRQQMAHMEQMERQTLVEVEAE